MGHGGASRHRATSGHRVNLLLFIPLGVAAAASAVPRGERLCSSVLSLVRRRTGTTSRDSGRRAAVDDVLFLSTCRRSVGWLVGDVASPTPSPSDVTAGTVCAEYLLRTLRRPVGWHPASRSHVHRTSARISCAATICAAIACAETIVGGAGARQGSTGGNQWGVTLAADGLANNEIGRLVGRAASRFPRRQQRPHQVGALLSRAPRGSYAGGTDWG